MTHTDSFSTIKEDCILKLYIHGVIIMHNESFGAISRLDKCNLVCFDFYQLLHFSHFGDSQLICPSHTVEKGLSNKES